MNETKKVLKWWWPWQTERIERFLEDMAGRGWALRRVGAACVSFFFERGEPARLRYCVDYQEKATGEYLALLADDGWKLEYKGSGWFVWSKAYREERPEIYTDRESLARRNSAILGSLCAVLTAQIPIAVVILDDVADKSPFALALLILWGLAVAVLAGAAIGMAVGVNKLKKGKGSR